MLKCPTFIWKITVNEQIIGSKVISDFSYAGNITPLNISIDITNKIKDISEELVLELGLVGSNGIDFVISDKNEIFVIEVNPRFQGSLDTVELSTDINLFDAHVKAFDGKCIKRANIKRFGAKKILFAEKEVKLETDFQKFQALWSHMVDIPRIGTAFSRGDPILTLLELGMNKKEVLEKLNDTYIKIRNIINFKDEEEVNK